MLALALALGPPPPSFSHRLVKEVDALAEVGGGGPSTSRLAGTSTRARGSSRYALSTSGSLRSLARAPGIGPAAAADLKHAEVLTWPGGLRVVFSGDLFTPPPPPSGIAATGDRRGGATTLGCGPAPRARTLALALAVILVLALALALAVILALALAVILAVILPLTLAPPRVRRTPGGAAELHGQQMGFFLALLDASSFDTAAGAPVPSRAGARLPGCYRRHCQAPSRAAGLPAAQPTAEHSGADEATTMATRPVALDLPGHAWGLGVLSPRRVFTEASRRQRLTGSAGAPAAYDTTSDGAQDSAGQPSAYRNAQGRCDAVSAAPSSAADGDGVAPPRPRHAQARSSSFDA